MYKHVCFHTYIATCGAKAAKEIRMYGIQYYKVKKQKMFVLNGLTDKKVTPYITNILAKTKIERKEVMFAQSPNGPNGYVSHLKEKKRLSIILQVHAKI